MKKINLNNHDYPLMGTITYDIVDQAHTRILKVAVAIRDVLEKHQIPYSIFFGSVIGSVRHKGFVPWDLDMDFGIFEDYDHVVKILKEELPSWLVVLDHSVDPNYCASWAKIADRFSEFHATTFGGDNDYKYRGLHVDLYNIKKTTYNKVCEYRKQEALDYYTRKLQAGTMSDTDYETQCEKVENKYIKEKSERSEANPDKPVLAFLKFFEGEPDCIFPLKKYIFEGEQFLGPNDHDKYLKSCYYKDDYMELPPYEKRDMKMDEIIIKPISLDE